MWTIEMAGVRKLHIRADLSDNFKAEIVPLI